MAVPQQRKNCNVTAAGHLLVHVLASAVLCCVLLTGLGAFEQRHTVREGAGLPLSSFALTAQAQSTQSDADK